MPSNTLLLIPNEFGTVFERLGRLEELEIQYSQPERETILHNRLLEALTFKATHIAILFAFLYRCNPQHKCYHNFSPQNNGAHVKVIQQ